MNDQVDRTVLPIRRPPVRGVTNKTLGGSQPGLGLIGHVKPPAGGPNILFVLIDDAGFGIPSTFGGPIRTPTYDRTAAQGLRYNRFHVTAMCSPTRAALLTGRNHHAVDMGGIPEFSGGFPGYSAMLPRDAAPFPKILKENGYATAGIGKCHLTPEKEQGPGWPVQPLAQRLGLRLLLGLPGPRGRAVRHHDLGEPRSPRRHGSRAAGTMMRRAAGEHYLHRPPPRAAVRGVPDAAAVPRGTGMIPGELRRRPGTIEIPATVTEREYGLVVVGSPTWWLSTNVPIRSFLESETAARVLTGKPFAGFVVCRRYWRHNLKTVRRLGAERGGEFLAGIHFKYAGGQVRSLLSLISYLGSSQYRDRYLGVKIPRTNIRDEQLDTARTFAHQLADKLRAADNPSA